MSLQTRLLRTWPGRWQLATAPSVEPGVAIAQAVSARLTPDDAVVSLIAAGHYDQAEELLTIALDPPIGDRRRRELLADLANVRVRARREVERTLDQLELRAHRAGGAIPIRRDDVVGLVELDAVEAEAELRRIESQVSDIEHALLRAYRERLDRMQLPRAARARVEACLQGRRWEAAERLIAGNTGLRVAAPSPADVPQPPGLEGHGSAVALADQLLRYPERVRERYDWRESDEPTQLLLEQLLTRDPSAAEVAVALDRVLGGEAEVGDDRVLLTSVEILPIPRPRFVGARGLALTLDPARASADEIVLDVRVAAATASPRLGITEMMRVLLADGDRRIALLRVVGRQLGARLLVSDLQQAANIDWALDWALDMATPRVAAPLLDTILSASSGRPRLAEALFVATVPSPREREGWLTERALERAIADPATQSVILRALVDDLAGQAAALELLTAVDEWGQPEGITTREDLVAFARELLSVASDTEFDASQVEAAVDRLLALGYARPSGDHFAFELGTIRVLDRSRYRTAT